MEIEERIARIERRLGLTGRGSAGDHEAEDFDLAAWMETKRRPGQFMVVIGSARDGGIGTSIRIWDPKDEPDEPTFDAKALAQLGQALASEARLEILRRLLYGELSTAELLEATGLEKGPLYHHLKELFLARMVEQRGRGRYAITGHGQMVFMVATCLPGCGGPTSEHGVWISDEAGDGAQATN